MNIYLPKFDSYLSLRLAGRYEVEICTSCDELLALKLKIFVPPIKIRVKQSWLRNWSWICDELLPWTFLPHMNIRVEHEVEWEVKVEYKLLGFPTNNVYLNWSVTAEPQHVQSASHQHPIYLQLPFQMHIFKFPFFTGGKTCRTVVTVFSKLSSIRNTKTSYVMCFAI